jgi:hypothetical protein
MLPGSLYGKFSFIKEMFDSEYQFNVGFPVQTLTGRRSFGIDTFEFGFPETQHISRNFSDFTDFSDLEIQFVREIRRLKGMIFHFSCKPENRNFRIIRPGDRRLKRL